MMVLKRFLTMALSALGLGTMSGLAIAQDHLPPPTDLTNVAECIRNYGGMSFGNPTDIDELDPVTSTTAAHTVGTRVSSDRYNPTLNTGAGTEASPINGIVCSGTSFRVGSNSFTIPSISQALNDARVRASGLPSLDDDEFAAELAALKQKYGGPLADKIYDEYKAALELQAAEQALMAKWDPPAPTGGGADPLPFGGASGSLVSDFRAIGIDQSAGTENTVQVSNLLTVASLPTVTRNAMGMVTGVTANGTAPTEGLDIMD